MTGSLLRSTFRPAAAGGHKATVSQQQKQIAAQQATAAQQQKQIEALTSTVRKVSDQGALSKAAPQLVANP